MQAVVRMFYQKSIKPTQTSTELENFAKELRIFSPVLTFSFEYFVQIISRWCRFRSSDNASKRLIILSQAGCTEENAFEGTRCEHRKMEDGGGRIEGA